MLKTNVVKLEIKKKNKAINEFKAELDAQYEKEGIVIQNPQEAPIFLRAMILCMIQ